MIQQALTIKYYVTKIWCWLHEPWKYSAVIISRWPPLFVTIFWFSFQRLGGCDHSVPAVATACCQVLMITLDAGNLTNFSISCRTWLGTFYSISWSYREGKKWCTLLNQWLLVRLTLVLLSSRAPLPSRPKSRSSSAYNGTENNMYLWRSQFTRRHTCNNYCFLWISYCHHHYHQPLVIIISPTIN